MGCEGKLKRRELSKSDKSALVIAVTLSAFFCGSIDLFMMYTCCVGCVEGFHKKLRDLDD